jgi:small subunit ribosomal protein S16
VSTRLPVISPEERFHPDFRNTDITRGFYVKQLRVLRVLRVSVVNKTPGKEPFSVLMIRLSRRGARKQPYYRIVVIEKDRARDGRSVEVVGTYNPRTNPATVDLKRERISYWTSKGAQLSDRVKKLVEKTPVAAPSSPEPPKPEPTTDAPSAA